MQRYRKSSSQLQDSGGERAHASVDNPRRHLGVVIIDYSVTEEGDGRRCAGSVRNMLRPMLRGKRAVWSGNGRGEVDQRATFGSRAMLREMLRRCCARVAGRLPYSHLAGADTGVQHRHATCCTDVAWGKCGSSTVATVLEFTRATSDVACDVALHVAPDVARNVAFGGRLRFTAPGGCGIGGVKVRRSGASGAECVHLEQSGTNWNIAR